MNNAVNVGVSAFLGSTEIDIATLNGYTGGSAVALGMSGLIVADKLSFFVRAKGGATVDAHVYMTLFFLDKV